MDMMWQMAGVMMDMKGGGGKGWDSGSYDYGKGWGKDGKSKKGKSMGQSSAQKKVKQIAPTQKNPSGKMIEVCWKSRLVQAWQATHKEGLTKESFVYSVEKDGSFAGTLSGLALDNQYSTDGPHETRRIAEESLAKSALENEFPQAYAAAPKSQRDASVDPVPGEKRTASNDGGLDAKCRLNQAMMVLSGYPLAKGAIEYSTEQSGGVCVSSVTLNCLKDKGLGEELVFEGAPAPDTKSAEFAAADVAFEAYQAIYEERLPEIEAKKAAKAANFAAKIDGLKADGIFAGRPYVKKPKTAAKKSK
jgi:hypothetical protein